MVNDGSHRISARPSLESQTYSHVLRVPRKAPLPAQINKVSTDVMVRFPQGNWKLLIDRHVYQEEKKYMIRAYAEIAFTFLCTVRSEKKQRTHSLLNDLIVGLRNICTAIENHWAFTSKLPIWY